MLFDVDPALEFELAALAPSDDDEDESDEDDEDDAPSEEDDEVVFSLAFSRLRFFVP